MPQISVLMPVWNGCHGNKEPFLRAAIQSILDQTFEDFEFVIVDDGSTDGTPIVLREYAAKDNRIRILTNPTNAKIVRTLNRGLADCKAPLIARMDADDLSTVTRLSVQKKFMDDRPATAMCGTGMYIINNESKLVGEMRHPCAYSVIRQTLKNGCYFVHGSVVYRKSVVDSLGGYSTDPAYDIAEDYELWVRMAEKHVVENIPDTILYYYRNHGGRSSLTHAQTQDASSKRIMAIAARILK